LPQVPGKREPWSPSAPPEAGKLAPPDKISKDTTTERGGMLQHGLVVSKPANFIAKDQSYEICALAAEIPAAKASARRSPKGGYCIEGSMQYPGKIEKCRAGRGSMYYRHFYE
jgi:hypothetical protein